MSREQNLSYTWSRRLLGLMRPKGGDSHTVIVPSDDVIYSRYESLVNVKLMTGLCRRFSACRSLRTVRSIPLHSLTTPLSIPPASMLTDWPSGALEKDRQLILLSSMTLLAMSVALMEWSISSLPGPFWLTDAMSPRVLLTATTLTGEAWQVMDLT